MGRWQRGEVMLITQITLMMTMMMKMMMIQVITGRLTSLWTAEQPFWDSSDVSHGDQSLTLTSEVSHGKSCQINL